MSPRNASAYVHVDPDDCPILHMHDLRHLSAAPSPAALDPSCVASQSDRRSPAAIALPPSIIYVPLPSLPSLPPPLAPSQSSTSTLTSPLSRSSSLPSSSSLSSASPLPQPIPVSCPSVSHPVLSKIRDVLFHFLRLFLAKDNLQNEGSKPPSHPSFYWFPSLPFRRMTLTRALEYAYLLSLSHANVRSNRMLSKRDVISMCPAFFPSMQVLTRKIGQLSEKLAIPSTHLHIVTATNGFVAGPLTFTDEEGAVINVSSFLPNGVFTPARAELIRDVRFTGMGLGLSKEGDGTVKIGKRDGDNAEENDIRVLVVEKEMVFRSLLAHKNAEKLLSKYVVITGNGYPDTATTNFILKLATEFTSITSRTLKLYLLTDADPHGIRIADQYRTHVSDVCDTLWLTACLWARREQLRLPSGALQKLGHGERVAGTKALRRWEDDEDTTRMILKMTMKDMLGCGEKFELEELESWDNAQLGLFEHVSYILQCAVAEC